MNCSSCGTAIAPGVSYCPSCGVPTPYYTSSQGSTPYNPTVAASPYSGPSGGQQMPPTEYGTPGGYPSSQPQDPYQSYNAPPPQNPYGAPANAQTPPAYNYGNPSAFPAQGYAPGMQPGMYGTVPPKRRSNVGIILGVIGAIVVLACVGSIVAAAALFKSPNTTTTTTIITPTTSNQNPSNGVSPSGQPISPDAAAIITNALTTSAIDNNYAPTHLTSTFTPGEKVYVTFDIDSKGSPGCSIAKWYDNNQLVDTSPLKHSPENQVAYFSLQYDAATQGAVELYWTTDTNCTGGQLAQVVKFTVGSQASTGGMMAHSTSPMVAIVPELQ
ncbi:MAG TPA: hypothetical protein VFU49_16720 [Ktedonobacteraceae bacterium]|nr:hypothetical protein [Ktedonobacteraceae bacterium]